MIITDQIAFDRIACGGAESERRVRSNRWCGGEWVRGDADCSNQNEPFPEQSDPQHGVIAIWYTAVAQAASTTAGHYRLNEWNTRFTQTSKKEKDAQKELDERTN